MWTVSVKARQSELNEARVTNERTNTSHDLLKLIYLEGRYYTVLHIQLFATVQGDSGRAL